MAAYQVSIGDQGGAIHSAFEAPGFPGLHLSSFGVLVSEIEPPKA